MVDLEKIREEMNKQYSIDKEIHSVEVHADTIDEALADAAVQLNSKVSDLQYEVIEKGSDGFLGLGKKPWTLSIYQDPFAATKEVKVAANGVVVNDSEENVEDTNNRDGLYYVRHFGANLVLKVIPPVGNGEPVDIKDILNELRQPDTIEIDESLVKKYAKHGTDNNYNIVGAYKHVQAGDALVFVETTKDEMKAMINVSEPSKGGSDASPEGIFRALQSQGVIEQCINMDKVNEFVDNPVYNVPFEVAAAIQPQDGMDAYISYNFETDPKKLKAKVSETGQINYKELNQIQNVISDQPLAVKIPPERGKGGKTIFGRYLEAKHGRDIQIQLGENVRLDRDGVTIKAAIDGEVMLVNGKVTVVPIKYLDAVNVKTGDIKFVGTVVIKGAVEEGYKVEATNIEIGGNVDPSTLIATENIIVRQGIHGKGVGYIKAGKSLWAKFIDQTNVEVEENVIVYDYIMNSNVTAMKTILLRGKRAQINGGHLLATEEICARYIGSAGGGTETILEVGIDPRSKIRLVELQKQQSIKSSKYSTNELDIQNLEQTKQVRKRLPQEKLDKLNSLKNENKILAEELQEISSEIDTIQVHLRDLKAVGKVKVEGTVYAGVKIYVRDLLDEIKMDIKNITFSYDKGFPTPKHTSYEPPSIKQEELDPYAAD